MDHPHQADNPSRWIERFAPLIAKRGAVLDLACGAGRHARYLAAQGFRVVAVDIDISRVLAANIAGVTPLAADLENAPWPFPARKFCGVIVANYLHRPLFPAILEALEAGGVLIYETFAHGNERFGKPANPDYLLEPGELLEVVRGKLRVVAYEDLIVDHPRPAAVQRICAVAR